MSDKAVRKMLLLVVLWCASVNGDPCDTFPQGKPQVQPQVQPSAVAAATRTTTPVPGSTTMNGRVATDIGIGLGGAALAGAVGGLIVVLHDELTTTGYPMPQPLPVWPKDGKDGKDGAPGAPGTPGVPGPCAMVNLTQQMRPTQMNASQQTFNPTVIYESHTEIFNPSMNASQPPLEMMMNRTQMSRMIYNINNQTKTTIKHDGKKLAGGLALYMIIGAIAMFCFLSTLIRAGFKRNRKKMEAVGEDLEKQTKKNQKKSHKDEKKTRESLLQSEPLLRSEGPENKDKNDKKDKKDKKGKKSKSDGGSDSDGGSSSSSSSSHSSDSDSDKKKSKHWLDCV